MKLVIEINGTVLHIANTNCGALFESLASAQTVRTSGYGSSKRYQLDGQADISVTAVADEQFDAIPDPIKKLQEEKAASDSRWIEYYNKASELEKQLKALKADLDARGVTYQQPEVKK